MAENSLPHLMPSSPATPVTSTKFGQNKTLDDEVQGQNRVKNDSQDSSSKSAITLTPSRTLTTEIRTKGGLTSGVVMRRRRDVCQDMEALRLSRQDNPFLQNLATRESILDADDGDTEDSVLVTKGYVAGNVSETLSLSEVHEHMIRSPPPSVLPHRNQSFQFPSQCQDENYTTTSCSQLQNQNAPQRL